MFTVQLPPPDNITLDVLDIADFSIQGKQYRCDQALQMIKYRYNTTVAPCANDNMYDFDWKDKAKKQKFEEAYPLRSLFDNVRLRFSREDLATWEVIVEKIVPQISAMTGQNLQLHGLYLGDNNYAVSEMMNNLMAEACRYLDIKYKWMASSHVLSTSVDIVNQNITNWLPTSEKSTLDHGTVWRWHTAINAANLVPDIIISTIGNHTNEIMFALGMLKQHGTAIIYIPNADNDLLTTHLYLFTACFEKAELIHTEADDRVYLCGIDYMGNQIQEMLDFIDYIPKNLQIIPRDDTQLRNFASEVSEFYVCVNQRKQTFYEKTLAAWSHPIDVSSRWRVKYMFECVAKEESVNYIQPLEKESFTCLDISPEKPFYDPEIYW